MLISGCGYTGKTLLSQKLLEKLSYPYLSVDHLKMGLVRARQTNLTPESDNAKLTAYLWPVVREVINTNIENGQNLIVEGCYIPFDYKDSFSADNLREINYVCLIFSERYLDGRCGDIVKYQRAIEKRRCDYDIPIAKLKEAHKYNLEMCLRYGLDYILIDEKYDINRYIQIITEKIENKLWKRYA